MLRRGFLLVLALLAGTAGCKRLQEQLAPEAPAAASAHATPKPAQGEHKDNAEHQEPKGPRKYDVPFAWEVGKDEPLARTRAFLGELLADNKAYTQRGEKYFQEFATRQTPRATVVSCADSRVQSPAWDATPENDDFTIRNIGNQVVNAHGSVGYGIEHLHTPLLLIVGHTGCGAVKAALGDTSELDAPIAAELKTLQLTKPSNKKQSEDDAWAAAVLENVNDQVQFSVEHFGRFIQEGRLVVVGAIFDLRNDFRQGSGKVLIVNVNGNLEPERMAAFVGAIGGVGATANAASATDAALAQLAEALKNPAAFKQRATPPTTPPGAKEAPKAEPAEPAKKPAHSEH